MSRAISVRQHATCISRLLLHPLPLRGHWPASLHPFIHDRFQWPRQPPQPRAPGRAVPHVPARWSDHDRASFPVDQWTYTMPWPSEQAQTVSQAQTSSIQSAPDPPFKSTLLATPTPAEYPFAARILPLLTVGAIAMCLVKALGVQQVLDRASKRWVGQTSLSQDDLDDSKHG